MGMEFLSVKNNCTTQAIGRMINFMEKVLYRFMENINIQGNLLMDKWKVMVNRKFIFNRTQDKSKKFIRASLKIVKEMARANLRILLLAISIKENG